MLDERQRHTAEEKPRQAGVSATSDLALSHHHSRSPLSSPIVQTEPGYIIPPSHCPNPCTPTPILENPLTPHCDSLLPKHLSSTAKSSFPLLSIVTLMSTSKKENEHKQIQWQHAMDLAIESRQALSTRSRLACQLPGLRVTVELYGREEANNGMLFLQREEDNLSTSSY
jgi:hypothetical protein